MSPADTAGLRFVMPPRLERSLASGARGLGIALLLSLVPQDATVEGQQEEAAPAAPPTSLVADALSDQDGDGVVDLDGQQVRLIGTLTTRFNERGPRAWAYMEDATRGVRLWIERDSLVERAYEPGYIVGATGRFAANDGQPLLFVSNLQTMGGLPVPPPRELTAGQVAGDLWGLRIRITGRLALTPQGPADAVLEDETGRVAILLPSELLLDEAFHRKVRERRRVSITGYAQPVDYEPASSRTYGVSVVEAGDVAFGSLPPLRLITMVVSALLLAGLVTYLGARRALGKRRSREMEEMVANLERVRATLEGSEKALRRSESHYRSLVDHAPFGVFRCTLEGRILSANEALVGMLGCVTVDDLVGRSLPSDVYEHDQEWDEVRASLDSGPLTPFEVSRWCRTDGSVARVRTRFRLVESGPDGTPTVQGFVEDVTEWLDLQDQLRQSQKMEAVGQLAGGVAHDFNNLLTVVLGSCEFLREEVGDALREEVLEIHSAAKKAAALTQQLLAFSRKQPLAPQVLEVNQAVTEAHKLLRRTLGEDVSMETRLDSRGGWVEVDPVQLQQVLLNLVVNARDAMPTGGSVTLATGRAIFDDEAVRRRPGARPGRYVWVSVTDTGSGMSDETMKHLFEPFFTTKKLGTGTGLGLATVYGIVKQSNGYIDVTTELGHGSTFTVCLPMVAAGVASDARDGPAPPRGGSETILLAEDEEPLRELARRVLVRAGYSVIIARDGEEAMRLADEFDGDIHAVVTDVVMPRKSGRQLAEYLASARPSTKVLYMSGYTDDAVIRHGVFEARESLLRKPFTPHSLLRELRTLLDAPSPLSEPGAESADGLVA